MMTPRQRALAALAHSGVSDCLGSDTHRYPLRQSDKAMETMDRPDRNKVVIVQE